MALTKVTYSMISGASVNVKDFDAMGDGTTNDTVAIQAAIDSLATTGGVVEFPAGTYRISKTQGTNDSWGLKLPKSNIALRGQQATLRRLNPDISTYVLAFPLILVGTPDSNVAVQTVGVDISGFIFQGENTQHAEDGSSLSDGRYAVLVKNASGVKIRNNRFTAVDSAAVYLQPPATLDYVNTAYYNTTKVYNVDISNNDFIATPHAVPGRALIHAITGSSDNTRIENNYFEWCDDAVAMESTYDDLIDVETDTYVTNGLTVKRSGRGMLINGNVVYNSSEHIFYMGTMDTIISNNVIRTDNFAVCNVGDIKVYGRNMSVTGNTITTNLAGIQIRDTAFNVTVSGNTIYSNGANEGGVIEIASAGLSAFIVARIAFLGPYYPMSNITVTGNTVVLPVGANASGQGVGVRIYTDSSDANYPEGQMRNVNIVGNSFKNHRVGVYCISNLARNINIDDNTFDAKPFTSSGFNDTTTLHTYCAVMVYKSQDAALLQVRFSNNKVWGATYAFATNDGLGTNVHLPLGIQNNQFSYTKNLSTSDFRSIKGFNKWQGNRGEAFLDGKAASTFTEGDLSQATRNYGAAAVDWTLTSVESAADYLVVTNASGAVNAIVDATTFIEGKTYNILNTSGQVLTFKRTTGGTIANGKLAIYLAGASDVFEVYEQP